MNSPSEILLEAARKVAAGNIDEAIAVVAIAIEQDSCSARKSEFFAWIGTTLESVGRYEEALKAFRAGGRNSTTPWCALHEARTRARLGLLTQTELKEIAVSSAVLTRNSKLVDRYVEEIRNIQEDRPIN